MSATLPQARITESEFQRQVLDIAVQYGWHIPAKDMRPFEDDPSYTLPGIAYHPMLSKWSERGWPDLTMVRVRRGIRRLLFAELKSDRGQVTPRQAQVLALLRHLEGKWMIAQDPSHLMLHVEVHVWRPNDLGDIVRVLA